MKKQILSLTAMVLVAGAVTLTGCKKDDTTAPVLTLKGAAESTLDLGAAFTDEGATAEDDRDGDISSKIVVTGTVDTKNVGTYTLTYDVADEAGNAATQVKRTVKVKSDKLAGTCAVTDVVTGSTIPNGNGTYNYNVTVTQSSTDYNKLLFSNFGGFANQNIVATVEGSSINIPSQAVGVQGQTGTVTVSGSGTYDGATGKITKITYSAGGGLGNGSATYSKQ